MEELDPPIDGWFIAKLQWGHGDGAVEERRRPRQPTGNEKRFNGATAMEPWKRELSCAKRSCGLSFNGATAMEPWKRSIRGPVAVAAAQASMGPRRWSRGRGRDAVRSEPIRGGFNGATALEPWKRPPERRRQRTRRRFNGATAMEPWKRARPPDRLEQRT